jgi:hypothetical protein
MSSSALATVIQYDYVMQINCGRGHKLRELWRSQHDEWMRHFKTDQYLLRRDGSLRRRTEPLRKSLRGLRKVPVCRNRFIASGAT